MSLPSPTSAPSAPSAAAAPAHVHVEAPPPPPPPGPALAPARAEALLSGLAPAPSGGPFAAAYRAGVAAALGSREAPRADAEVSPREIGLLLSAGCKDVRLRTLAARALLHLAEAARDAASTAGARDAAAAAFVEALAGGGALKGLVATAAACAAACEARPADAEPLIEAAAPEVHVLAHSFSMVLKETVAVPGEVDVVMPLLPKKHGLEAADMVVATDAATVFLLAVAAAPKLGADSIVLHAMSHMCVVLAQSYRLGDDMFETMSARFAEKPGAIRASFQLLARYPATRAATRIANLLGNAADSSAFCSALLLPESCGVAGTLAEISSTMHDTDGMLRLLNLVSNACGQAGAIGAAASRCFAEHNVFELLQPPLLSSVPSTSLRAAFAVATLAVREDLVDLVEKTDVTSVMLDVLRSTPLGVTPDNMSYSRGDLDNIVALLSASSRPALQLACLHSLAACLTGTDATETQDFLRGEPSALAGLRVAAASGDAFVFSGAAFVLSKLGEAVPVFRDGRAAAAEAAAHEEPATWSIETVCAWVSKQAFRAYKPAFRDNFVSGEMLLSLSDEDLAATLGVPNALHRRAILFAIARLSSGPAGHSLSRSPRSTAGDGGGGGGGGAASSPSASPAPSVLRIASPRAASAAAEQTYDVFLSYRRAGGADFAQLIKLLLRAEGLNVFLDVENLAVSALAQARAARALADYSRLCAHARTPRLPTSRSADRQLRRPARFVPAPLKERRSGLDEGLHGPLPRQRGPVDVRLCAP